VSQPEYSLADKVNNAIDQLGKLERSVEEVRPKVKEAEVHLDMLKQLVEDIYALANISKGKEDAYMGFKLYITYDASLDIYTPDAEVYLGVISKECLRQKTLYQCLDEKFSDKTPLYDALMREFSKELDELLFHIKSVIPSIQTLDRIRREVEEIKETVTAIRREVEQKSQE
jgi:archaellum component FlaC